MSRENKPACSQFCRHDNFSGLCEIFTRQHERGRGAHGSSAGITEGVEMTFGVRRLDAALTFGARVNMKSAPSQRGPKRRVTT